MSERLDRKIKRVNMSMVEMTTLVNRGIRNALEAFEKKDFALAEEVIEDDFLINDKELDIDRKCVEVIALQHPVSSVLRGVISVMKASSDLERIGDHAASIAKATIQLEGKESYPVIEKQLYEVGQMIYNMGNQAVEAFIKEDAHFAQEIASHNQVVSEKYSEFYDAAVAMMIKDSDSVLTMTEYLKVGRYLERIGDYITNVCEWSVYRETGEMVDLK
ncbi:phosphate signaling complex protein PhoU [Vagococcus coleopterorum]|uniref:Phosphate-specific transport system accessory protein PhoU n=1 Tax=Vagococcus coleopterorum TaxID=2714946 RepID=A0A6G8AN98_9ENTE|nr:phosphate signaling complex protein PhoU [Vagococcus coleopterorum]QIL46476.1 phosphate signaling complex protein PhoU [Vagococcus coleopterorum]